MQQKPQRQTAGLEDQRSEEPRPHAVVTRQAVPKHFCQAAEQSPFIVLAKSPIDAPSPSEPRIISAAPTHHITGVPFFRLSPGTSAESPLDGYSFGEDVKEKEGHHLVRNVQRFFPNKDQFWVQRLPGRGMRLLQIKKKRPKVWALGVLPILVGVPVAYLSCVAGLLNPCLVGVQVVSRSVSQSRPDRDTGRNTLSRSILIRIPVKFWWCRGRCAGRVVGVSVGVISLWSMFRQVLSRYYDRLFDLCRGRVIGVLLPSLPEQAKPCRPQMPKSLESEREPVCREDRVTVTPRGLGCAGRCPVCLCRLRDVLGRAGVSQGDVHVLGTAGLRNARPSGPACHRHVPAGPGALKFNMQISMQTNPRNQDPRFKTQESWASWFLVPRVWLH